MVCLVIPATMVDLGSVYIKDFQEKLVDQDPQVLQGFLDLQESPATQDHEDLLVLQDCQADIVHQD